VEIRSEVHTALPRNIVYGGEYVEDKNMTISVVAFGRIRYYLVFVSGGLLVAAVADTLTRPPLCLLLAM